MQTQLVNLPLILIKISGRATHVSNGSRAAVKMRLPATDGLPSAADAPLQRSELAKSAISGSERMQQQGSLEARSGPCGYPVCLGHFHSPHCLYHLPMQRPKAPTPSHFHWQVRVHLAASVGDTAAAIVGDDCYQSRNSANCELTKHFTLLPVVDKHTRLPARSAEFRFRLACRTSLRSQRPVHAP